MLDEVNFELCGGKVPGDLRVRTSQQNKYLRMNSDREEGVKLAAGLRVQVVAVGKVIHKEGGSSSWLPMYVSSEDGSERWMLLLSSS
jgi:hypothetical protein